MRAGWLVLAALALSCVGPAPLEGEAVEESHDESVSVDAVSAFSDAVVSLRRDLRRCAAPACGGYFVRDINRSGAEVYVRALDFARAGLDAQSVDDVRDAPDGAVLLRGRLGALDYRSNTRALLVAEAWRALPGVEGRAGDVVYRIDRGAACVGLPCPRWRATRVNVGSFASFHELLASVEVSPWLDRAWLLQEAYTRGALVLGATRRVRSYYTVLDASQVFLRLPQRAACRTPSVAACPAGQSRSFSRGLDRCLTPGACVTPGACDAVPVACPEGYIARRWADASGCTAAVCDPAFAR